MDLDEKRILIVEDEYVVAQDLARTFRALGARVIGPAATVEAAVGLAQQQQLDAAVVDIHLRDETAYTIADLLLSKSIPFVFTTGHDPGRIPERFAQVRLCEKPVEPATLAEALAEFSFEEPQRIGETLTYHLLRQGAIWRWLIRKNGQVVDQGITTSRLNARVAAFSAAMNWFH